MFYYETLNVYQKAFTLNREIYQYIKKNNTIPLYMRNQLGRASLSIMLNIAEGTAKNTGSKDRRNFYTIARGSSFEAASLIKFLITEKEISTELAQNLHTTLEDISKMLFSLIRAIDNNSRQRS